MVEREEKPNHTCVPLRFILRRKNRTNSIATKANKWATLFVLAVLPHGVWIGEGRGPATVVCETVVNGMEEIVIWNKRKLKWTRTRQHIKNINICQAFPYDSRLWPLCNNCNLWTRADCWLIDGIRYKLHLRYWCELVNWSISCAVWMENGSPRDWGTAIHMTMWSDLLCSLLLSSFVLNVPGIA